ncbi:MAG: hypothetical protein HOA14_05845, partial [Planctomycetaceae bacterium]|nr:hypothetical protein [Planctomycetaceae bacterium]
NLVGKNLGFETDRNAVEVFWRGGEASFPIAAKDKLAEDLVALIGTQYLESISADTQIELPTIAIRD